MSDETPKKKLFDEYGNEVVDAVSPEEAARQVEEARKQAEEEAEKKSAEMLENAAREQEAKDEQAKKDHEAELERIKNEQREAILHGNTNIPAGKVLVSEEALNDLIRRVERVEGAADVGRLAKMDDKNRKEPLKVVRLGVWQGNIITGWKLKANNVEKVNGVWRELQTIELKFEVAPAVEVPYLQFVQETQKVDATIISRTKDEGGDFETLKVRTNDDGKEVLIDSRFVNL